MPLENSKTSYDINHTYLQKHQAITKDRIKNFINSEFWSSVNLSSVLWKKETSAPSHIVLEVWSPSDLSRPTFVNAINQSFRPTHVGESFGPAWSTHWFRISVSIPDDYEGEQVVFQFDPKCEAMIWDNSGHPVQGITGADDDTRRVEYILTECAKAGEKYTFYAEVACNGLFGTGLFEIAPPIENRYYTLTRASIGVKNQEAWHMMHDLETILGMVDNLGQDNSRRINALYAANQMVNVFDRDNLDDSVAVARKIASEFLSVQPSSGTHQITTIGHCHIDTAWLWTYDETKRKVARSFASQLNLMEKYPEFKFIASQAQQFEWLENNYSDLSKKVHKFVKSGQFVITGGTWIEMDCNIPNGESLVRQFLYGQRYFMQKFGVSPKIFWLPDTFGYAAQLPQIVLQTGGKYFFTQKLSWNNINKFPHSTFNWVGLDGSSILTHMAPAATYNGNARVDQIIKSETNHCDLSSHNTSLYLYGNGDGGGGPQAEMIERIRRMSNTEGIPKIKHADPTEFYDDIAKNARSLPNWRGELYFELHRGTYTSQALTKKYNRKSEFLLRSAELLSTLAYVSHTQTNSFDYPYHELLKLWKLLCLNQFHDVIPGSSIELVYKDSDGIYRDIIKSANQICRNAILRIVSSESISYDSIINQESTSLESCSSNMTDNCASIFGNNIPCSYSRFVSNENNDKEENSVLVYNSCAWERTSVVTLDGSAKLNPIVKQSLKPRKSLYSEGFSDVAAPNE
ncbi:hypothetical protein BB558_007170, partial [Smittium angustum]